MKNNVPRSFCDFNPCVHFFLDFFIAAIMFIENSLRILGAFRPNSHFVDQYSNLHNWPRRPNNLIMLENTARTLQLRFKWGPTYATFPSSGSCSNCLQAACPLRLINFVFPEITLSELFSRPNPDKIWNNRVSRRL